MQRCYRNLELPVEFKPWDFGYTNKNQFCEFNISPSMINQEVHDFFDSIGLVLLRGRYFHALPGEKYTLHTDNKYEPTRELVKINWIYGGAGSEMIWYQLKPGKTPISHKNKLGENIVGYNPEDCTEICRSPLSKLSLVNVGIVHTIHNAGHFRDCYSLVLAHKNNKRRLDWDEAVQILSTYIKE